MIVPGIVLKSARWPMGSRHIVSAVQDRASSPVGGPSTVDLNNPRDGHDEGGSDDIAHEINPLFGAAFFFLAGALRLHPATATGGLLLGVGAAVINYGAGKAGAEERMGGGGAF